MCLAIPGKVVETYQEHEMLMGKVDFGGVAKRICLEYVPEVRIGEYVLVHVGFALSVIDEQEAKQVFSYLREMNELDDLAVDESAGGGVEAGSREHGAGRMADSLLPAPCSLPQRTTL